MIARIGRWLAVVVCAWALRHGLTPDELMGGLTKAYRYHDGAWRLDVIEAAQARNGARVHG